MLDQFDASGLMPGAAEWAFTPDQGQTLDGTGWCAPAFGGDVTCTTAYPSQEPGQAVQWPRDGIFTGPTTDTGQGI